MSEIVDCPALRVRRIDRGYPFGDKVPKTVRLRQTVTADMIPGIGFLSPSVAVHSATYPAWTNSYGAVAAVLGPDNHLGLKPDEFDVIEWHEPAPTAGQE